MRILGCLDGTNAEPVARAARMFAGNAPVTFGLLTVVDTGPRRAMDLTRARFGRPPLAVRPGIEAMLAVEQAGAEAILAAGLAGLPGSEPLLRQGQPERAIIQAASDWQAEVLIVCPRALLGAPAETGPRSVGHVARFVLDHAPCPVLLLRPPFPGPAPEARRWSVTT